VNVWMCRYFSCRIDEFFIKLIKIFMQIIYDFCTGIQCIFSVFHRKCSRMVCLSTHRKFIIYHAAHALDYSDLFIFCIKHRSLLSMKFHKSCSLFGVHPVFFTALISAFLECIFKIISRNIFSFTVKHIFLFKFTAQNSG
jgi:hypothetical protein